VRVLRRSRTRGRDANPKHLRKDAPIRQVGSPHKQERAEETRENPDPQNGVSDEINEQERAEETRENPDPQNGVLDETYDRLTIIHPGLLNGLYDKITSSQTITKTRL